MIVLDASTVFDLLLNVEPAAGTIAERVAREAPALSAPHLLALPIHRHSHAALLQRAFELYENTTFYDALYLALAEGLDAPLLTRDRALARVPHTRAVVEVV